jgi:hypothetical protein
MQDDLENRGLPQVWGPEIGRVGRLTATRRSRGNFPVCDNIEEVSLILGLIAR